MHKNRAAKTLLTFALLHEEMIAAVPFHRKFAGTCLSDTFLGAAVGLQFGHKDAKV